MERATSREGPLLGLHCLPDCRGRVCHRGSRKKKIKQSHLRASINTQLFISPQKIQCHPVRRLFDMTQIRSSYPKRAVAIDPSLWYRLCFFAGNLINSYINSSLLRGALWVFHLITQINRCSHIRWGLWGTAELHYTEFPIQISRTETALHTCQHLPVIGVHLSR